MQRLRNLAHIMRITRADKLFVSYLGLFFVIAALITLVEPDIKTYGEGVWYCYTMSATIGFGDMVAVTIVGRILTIFHLIHHLKRRILVNTIQMKTRIIKSLL